MKRLKELLWGGRRRWITSIIVTLTVIAGGMLLYLDEQHRFDLRTEPSPSNPVETR